MNLTSLRSSARGKVGPTITSVEYPDANVDASLNEWYRTVLSWVMLASGIWEFKGNMATADLVGGQNEYVLPSNMIWLNRVEIKYPNSTSFVKASRLDDKSTESAFKNGSIDQGSEAYPVFRPFDNSIFIYPAPLTAMVGGLAIEICEDITDLAAGADVPNLNPLIHKALAIGAAYDYCVANEMYNKANVFKTDIFGRTTRSSEPSHEALKTQIEELAAQRDRSVRGRLTPRATSFR